MTDVPMTDVPMTGIPMTDIFNLAPETVASIRALYDRGAPTTDICEQFGIKRKSFWAFRRAQGWPLRAQIPCAEAPHESVAPAALIARLEETVVREIGRAEKQMKGRTTRSAETRARTLASLVKTLAELKRLKGDGAKAGDSANGVEPPDQPRELAELREELSRRLKRLAAERDE